MAYTQAELDAVREKHPEAVCAASHGYEVILRKATRGEFKRWKQQFYSDKTQSEAIENLFRSACVAPDRDTVERMLDDVPGLSEVFGKIVLELSGVGTDAEKKFA